LSLHEQENFIKEIHPFDTLTSHELNPVLKHMDIAYYKKETVLISPEKLSNYFYIIIKGEVNQYHNDELTFVYHEQDEFDADSLIYNKTDSTFIVSEDLICYLLKKDTFLELMQTNKKFETFFLKDLSARLKTLKNKEYGSDISSFMFGTTTGALSNIIKAYIVTKDGKLLSELINNFVIEFNYLCENLLDLIDKYYKAIYKTITGGK